MSIIGLPIDSLKHEYKRISNSRLISVKPSSNLILFSKEVNDTELNIENKLLISQNVIDKVHNDINVNIEKCTIGISYSHQTIITNIDNKSKYFELFIQVPQGGIPLNSTYYTNSIKMKLDPYETKNYIIDFYFPYEGKFNQYHPLAYENSKIISIGNGLSYHVHKVYIPSKKEEIVQKIK